jgi:hypothetical protein
VVLVALSGAGKTYFMKYLARTLNGNSNKTTFVVPILHNKTVLTFFEQEADKILQEQGEDLKAYTAAATLLDKRVTTMIWVHVFCATVLHDLNATPVEIISYFKNDGRSLLEDMILNHSEHITWYSTTLKHTKPVFVFDEAGLYLSRYLNRIILNEGHKDQTVVNANGELVNGGNMFTVMYRAARTMGPTLFMGTTFSLFGVERSISGTAQIGVGFHKFVGLDYVFANQVYNFLNEFINISPDIDLLCLYLQGRPRHFEVFLTKLLSVCSDHSKRNVPVTEMTKHEIIIK